MRVDEAYAVQRATRGFESPLHEHPAPGGRAVRRAVRKLDRIHGDPEFVFAIDLEYPWNDDPDYTEPE